MTSSREFKDAIYEQFARVGKAVASPKRIELLELIAQGEHPVEALARESGITVANASQHLQALRQARLVETKKLGVQVFYRLASQEVAEFMKRLRSLAENHITEIEHVTKTFLHERGAMEPVDKHELFRRVKQEAVTVIDVRPIEEYRTGHLHRAISIPLQELEDRFQELPMDREIVAYCRGPYCVLAIEAVEKLRAKGFQAVRLEYGVAELMEHGFRIDFGDTGPMAGRQTCTQSKGDQS